MSTETTKRPFIESLRALFKRRHDCRSYLPSGDRVKEGVEMECRGCGALNVRYDYDDDWGEGTATFCGWQRLTEPLRIPEGERP